MTNLETTARGGITNRGRLIAVAVGVAVLGAVLFANLGPADGQPGSPPAAQAAEPPRFAEPAPTPGARTRPRAAPPTPDSIQRGFGSIVDAVRPAVVSVSANPEHTGFPTHAGMQMLDPFPAQNGLVGSGVIIDRTGYILSSDLVTRGAHQVHVRLHHGGANVYSARRVATDPQTGLVLLKLPSDGRLPYAPLGNSNAVRTGDLVVALGSPFGLAETVTQGIVSTSRRTIAAEGNRLVDVIQTDAAINTGNCGGPLVNIQKQVIGINIAIYSTDTTFSGVGFAIPANRAREFVSGAIGR
ncbi:MAG: trypsin-like peptidase domain-containing protein [Deltaproteobacteria bacterium]|nr:trypsin-like peptidase domain-containing protein [Deltaproteobacteria bacterium]